MSKIRQQRKTEIVTKQMYCMIAANYVFGRIVNYNRLMKISVHRETSIYMLHTLKPNYIPLSNMMVDSNIIVCTGRVQLD